MKEWQQKIGDKKEGENLTDHYGFYPLHWLVNGYKLTGLDEETMECLETRKRDHMRDRGYMVDTIGGYNVSIQRTCRVEVDDGMSGMYECRMVQSVLSMSWIQLTISIYVYFLEETELNDEVVPCGIVEEKKTKMASEDNVEETKGGDDEVEGAEGKKKG
jgi:hypothetical protein